MPVLAALVLVGCLIGCWVEPPGWLYRPLCLLTVVSVVHWLAGIRPVALLAGFLWAGLAGHEYREQLLPVGLQTLPLVIEGRLMSAPDDAGGAFTVRLAGAGRAVGEWPQSATRVRLVSYDSDLTLRAGEYWQLHVRLKKPHGFVNARVFDRAAWLLREDIAAVGYVTASALNVRIAAADTVLSVGRGRTSLRERLHDVVGESPAWPFVLGLATGMRDAINDEQWHVLRATGTTHLLAISGLHIGLVAVLCWYLGRLLSLVAGVPLAGWLSLTGAACYALLAGMTIPTQRALLMVMLVLLLRWRQRCWHPGNIIAGALLVVLFVAPHGVLAAGFWLSFVAVILLTMFARNYPAGSRLLGACRTQWLLTLGLALPGLWFFQLFSLLAVPANLLAVPIFAIAVVPLTLMGSALLFVHVGIGSSLLNLGTWILEGVWRLLEMLAQAGWGVMEYPGIAPSTAVLVGAGLTCMALPRPLFAPVAGAGLILAGLTMQGSATPPVRLHILDVGQGLAVIVQTAEGTTIFDTGPAWPGGDAGAAVMVPYLHSLGVHELDTLVISHGDNDHRGGMAAVLREFSVGRVYMPRARSGRHAFARECRRGEQWQSGAARLRFVHPREAAGWSDNNASCVLLVEVDGHRILLPGDIEQPAERVLLGRADIAAADIVIAPHHGSSTSSSPEFVGAVKPRFTVFTVGFLNRWGFPAQEVAARWRATGSCLLSTAASGGLTFDYIAGRGFVLVGEAARRWQRPWPVRSPADAGCAGRKGL